MTRIERSALVTFSCEQMFELVNDIEAYPHYMPGCVGAKILERGDGWLKARLDLSRLGIKQSFSTHNELSPPHVMSLELEDGPFKFLRGEWRFDALNDSACKVVFWLEFEVANALLSIALPKLMEQVAGEQVDALCQRAKHIYSHAQ